MFGMIFAATLVSLLWTSLGVMATICRKRQELAALVNGVKKFDKLLKRKNKLTLG